MSRRASIIDPIKAEVCGMSDHDAQSASAAAREPSVKLPQVENAEVGVCPIRFLDQHSPEEVATYFENHKHELPRSHEICVRRYQSNEDQIKELDAKYGNLVSMIQGLGQKHKDYLPDEPEEMDEEVGSHLSDEKVRKWASSVSAQAPATGIAEEEQDDERKPHFERDLREVRVGESPSRPWGIQVPLQYLEKAESNVSSKPAQVTSPASVQSQPNAPEAPKQVERPVGKCPFGHGAAGPSPHGPTPEAVDIKPTPQPMDSPAAKPEVVPKAEAKPVGYRATSVKEEESKMVFNGPVFFGYSAEDVASILRSSGLKPNQ
jgi:hypothetical protein